MLLPVKNRQQLREVTRRYTVYITKIRTICKDFRYTEKMASVRQQIHGV